GLTREGIGVESPRFGSWQMTWRGSNLRAVPAPEKAPSAARWALQADPVTHPDAQGALQLGIEPRFGVYADLMLATEHGSATQRLRWIEPGVFLMGSPESEAGRYEDEGPPHEVAISQGFWLFDTPCTQALWETVMDGENPSDFKSPDRPVEQVSWDDVQEFLKRTNALVPGLDLVLPTEAQWEYACRAGTETALYTGDMEILGESNAPALDPIAWYGGNSGVDFELANGVQRTWLREMQYPEGLAGTHPVKRKQPNSWGLYDMLGNVWEWCADGRRTYTADGMTDPVGPTEAGLSRVLRGGAWLYDAWRVRSAFRLQSPPDSRNYSLGFRCARVQADRERRAKRA
ncbi:MAG: formylglycine-generating enzyme family protein, partial [Gammaproteobacteria bacterium]